ncbi:hypothetical protein WJX73_003573 [Symbiochloris irregularis]|uniref:RWD domain-containing protein n=1 Tax=Symbiochloris irregularis TaxID=706552 RepID=A0AAW1P0M1_9CHLO
MSAAQELFQAEIEALQAQYSDTIELRTQEGSLEVSFEVRPELSSEGSQNFVQLRLTLKLPSGYPDEPPSVIVTHSKGLAKQRLDTLQARLKEESVQLQGDPMLGQLYEAAKATLTELNAPEGTCVLCLESLDAPADTREPVLLPCYHCYHWPCFKSWWRWEQRDRRARHSQLLTDLGANAAAELAKQSLIPNADGAFTVGCPICREGFDAAAWPLNVRAV